MAKSDWENVDDISRKWDQLIPSRSKLSETEPLESNIYDKKVESKLDSISNDDENLLTSYSLLASHGLDSAIGQMMASYAEETLPNTITQVFLAYEKSLSNTNTPVSFQNNNRGLLIMCYAWAYTMKRTQRLTVKDRSFHLALAELSATDPASSERLHLTKTTESKLISTLGLLIHAMSDAKFKANYNQEQFFVGSLMALYSLANLTYGVGIE